jgi:hypothetical protein
MVPGRRIRFVGRGGGTVFGRWGNGRIGSEEGFHLIGERRVDAEQVAGQRRRLLAEAMVEEGGRGAHGFEEGAGQIGGGVQALAVDLLGWLTVSINSSPRSSAMWR